MRRSLFCLAVPVCVATLLALGVPSANASPAFIETHTSNPVTAEPPVSALPTPHCTVTLADQFPSNAADGTPQNYSGTLTPPAACPGPWAKVVLTHTISVSGRQYDRVDSLRVGNSDIYWGTTEEPSGPTPTTYTFSKDVTEYSSLLRTPQPYTGGIGNYTSSVYTGNYLQTVTMTYYEATSRYPVPDVPDVVVGLGADGLNPSTTSVTHTLSGLPTNITRAYLEVTLEGGGCDEQWFSDVPDDVAAKYASAGMCGHGPYREADVSLDGKPVAAVHTFPHIYSGGIVPTLWRPIPAIGTFDMLPETVDVTPFAGMLVDGASHQLSYSVQNIGDSWSVVTNLLLYTDHHAARTYGALTADDVAPTATENVTESDVSGGGTRVVDSTARHDVTAGWLQTSAGRIDTTVVRTMAYRNDDTVTDGGLTQAIRQSDTGTQTSTATRGGRIVAGLRHSYDYPLDVDYSAANFVNDQNFSLSGTVDMTQTLADEVAAGQGWRPVSASTENVDSYGILARSNGVTSESDGHSTSYYAGRDDQGRPYLHYLASNHGIVTKDVTIPPQH